MDRYIAHMNWAVLKAPWGDPAVAGFTDNAPRVSMLAQRAPGFVWQLSPERIEAGSHITADWGPADCMALTLSVWKSVEQLERFVHGSVHGSFLERRDLWFEPADEKAYVLWFVDKEHRPNLAEGAAKRALYRSEGPTDEAFDFEYAMARV